MGLAAARKWSGGEETAFLLSRCRRRRAAGSSAIPPPPAGRESPTAACFFRGRPQIQREGPMVRLVVSVPWALALPPSRPRRKTGRGWRRSGRSNRIAPLPRHLPWWLCCRKQLRAGGVLGVSYCHLKFTLRNRPDFVLRQFLTQARAQPPHPIWGIRTRPQARMERPIQADVSFTIQ